MAGVLHRASFRLAKHRWTWRRAPTAELDSLPARTVFTVTQETTELNLPSRVESIEEAAAAVADVARRAGFDEEARFGLDMAVREAVTNAVLHGNKRDEAKSVELGVTASETELAVSVRDRGEGFDPGSVADPTAEENLLKTSGRGILFMRTFMDEVTWERHPGGGTVVRMTKKK